MKKDFKKIWIDGYEANVPQRLGSGQVAFEIIKNIAILDKKNDYTVLLPSVPLDDMPKESENFHYKILKPRRLWTRIALPIALFTSRHKPDVFFSPTHYSPIISPSGIKKILTIFDLAFLHFPQFFKQTDLYKLNNWTKGSIERSDHVVTISQSSKRDIAKFYKYDKSKITVCYPGYDANTYKQVQDEEKVRSVCSKYGVEGSYVVFLGTLQPRKNLITLMEAVSKIEGLKLVAIGKKGGDQGRGAWMVEKTLSRPKELGIEDRVIFTGYVPTEDVPYLFAGSVAFVSPSLYEGFGIPVLDAMATGTPVVVSDVSSLPEVVGNAGVLVEPKSVDQIEQAIRLLMSDKRVRNSYIKKGLSQVNKFSWRKMAKEVVKVFENI